MWCDEKLSKFVDQRNKTKLQLLQDPNHTNVHNGKMYDVKIANTARSKEGNIWNEIFISYEHTVRTIKL